MIRKVTIVSFPWPSIAPYKFISDVIKILDPICDEITILDGNTNKIVNLSNKVTFNDIGIQMHYSNEITEKPWSYILWAYKCLKVQLREAKFLIQKKGSDETVIFYMAYPYYLPQLIVCKISGKKTIEIVTRSAVGNGKRNILALQDRFLFSLLDGISLESNMLLTNHSMPKDKILLEGARFIDVEKYRILKPYIERSEKIGYIGRISREKGVMSFVHAIPSIAKATGIKEFFIGGTGNALDDVRRESATIEKNIGVTIDVPGFLQEGDMPSFLNDIKMLVFPTTHTEGLPTIVLEAMACGTPVISTSKGALNSVILHGERGFLLSGVDPQNMSSCIKFALEANLEKNSSNCREYVVTYYSLANAISRWSKIIDI